MDRAGQPRRDGLGKQCGPTRFPPRFFFSPRDSFSVELISDRPFETMLAELKRLKQEYPDRVLIASIMEARPFQFLTTSIALFTFFTNLIHLTHALSPRSATRLRGRR